MNLDTPCQPFLGYITEGGYGRLNGTTYAHRAAWEIAIGPVPDGMIVGHACHDADESCSGGASCMHRRCVNIEHLALQTYSENATAGRRNYGPRQSFCKRGHFVPPERRRSGLGCKECMRIRSQMKRDRDRAAG